MITSQAGKNDRPDDLLTRLYDEAEEVRDNLDFWRNSYPDRPSLSREIGNEAADVANFAMMIADVCGALQLDPAPAVQEQELLNAPYVSTEALKDIIARAYEDGCSETHQEIHRNPDRASERHPEFGEAASDYSYEVISRLRTQGSE